MAHSLKKLAAERTGKFRKAPENERFLESVNDHLLPLEKSLYKEVHPKHPFLFVIGLPRAGTTFTSQVLAAGLDSGYINNFTARYYKAPVTGIRLFHAIYGRGGVPGFDSDYAQTGQVTDIHEFGYFWRYWFKLGQMEDFIHYQQKTDEIDWKGLKNALANIQGQFDKPLVMKNVFGAMFIPELIKLLPRVLFVFIERDPLDVCCSIMDARRKFYDDPSTWWSTMPPEVGQLIDLPPAEQVAGQVYYLQKFYAQQMNTAGNQAIRLQLPELAQRPEKGLRAVAGRIRELWGHEAGLSLENLPAGRAYHHYKDREGEREQFERLLKSLKEKDQHE